MIHVTSYSPTLNQYVSGLSAAVHVCACSWAHPGPVNICELSCAWACVPEWSDVSDLTSVRLCACFSKSALCLSACLTWKELLWLWRTNTISRRSGWTQRTKMWDLLLTCCEEGSWQSMTFWEQDKIRGAFRMTEVIFANLYYWPGDNNQHIKSLIGLGRDCVNVTAQTVLLNNRLAVKRDSFWGSKTPKRFKRPSCPLLTEQHNCTVSKTQYCYTTLRPRLKGSHLLSNVSLKPASTACFNAEHVHIHSLSLAEFAAVSFCVKSIKKAAKVTQLSEEWHWLHKHLHINPVALTTSTIISRPKERPGGNEKK